MPKVLRYRKMFKDILQRGKHVLRMERRYYICTQKGITRVFPYLFLFQELHSQSDLKRDFK